MQLLGLVAAGLLVAIAALLSPLAGARAAVTPAEVVRIETDAPVAPVSLDLVGAWDPGTPGYNAMAVGLGSTAFLGSWGSASYCPGLGVRILDISDPTQPYQISSAAEFPRTTAEHVVALHMDNEWFAGDLLLTGIQSCSTNSEQGGLSLWDVSNPAAPRELAFFPVEHASRGVHEFTIAEVDGRWYAYLTVPNAEYFEGTGELKIVDFTDPHQPWLVADWGARRDAALPIGYGRDCAPYCRGSIGQAFLHSVSLSPDSRLAYLSYWDLGVIILDVSDPSWPYLVGHHTYSSLSEGNTHSIALAHGGEVALVVDETFETPWGHLRMLDVSDPSSPYQVGEFWTPNNAAERPGSQSRWYSAHNPYVDDRDPRRAYVAWYSDGVRVLDISDLSAPAELAAWVPPSDPFVWSLHLHDDLVIVGDVHRGLYILRRG